MIELNKQSICVGEKVCSSFSQAYCEADIIVPDVKPDIAKVLQTDATISVSTKTVLNDKVMIDGMVHMSILYIGETGDIKCILYKQPYSHTAEVVGAVENMDIELETDIESVDYTIINSRKLLIKVLIGVDINVIHDVVVEVPVEIKCDAPFETLTKTIEPSMVVARKSEEIVVRERLELPQGKPSIQSILKLDVKVVDKETKLVYDKLILKGNLSVSALYLGEMEENNLQLLEYKIPFTEIVEADGADEDMNCSVSISTNDIMYESDEDSDGDCRIINLECMLNVHATIYNETPIEIIEDAYSITEPLLVSRQSEKTNRMCGNAKAQVVIKDTVSIPFDMPEVTQIYNVVGKPHIANTKIEYGKVVIDGVMSTDILYMSNAKDYPLCTHKSEVKFNQHINIDGANEDMLCDIRIDDLSIDYNITMSHEIDIRFIISVSIRVICEEDIDYISEVIMGEEVERKHDSAIKIYFVQKGDKVWDIAKRYHTTRENILKANNINDDSDIVRGKQIFIP